ncbi:hypothetical protein HK405_002914, partial [Cladochytrium tenue]
MILTEAFIASNARGFARTACIADVYQARVLNLWGQNISDISVLRKLEHLEVLSLAVNRVSDLSPLAGLARLRELYLRRNCVRDPAQLLHLRGLPLLSHLWIEDNPVCAALGGDYRVAVLRLLPSLLCLDDRPVGSAERARATALGPYHDDDDLARAFPWLPPDPHTSAFAATVATASRSSPVSPAMHRRASPPPLSAFADDAAVTVRVPAATAHHHHNARPRAATDAPHLGRVGQHLAQPAAWGTNSDGEPSGLAPITAPAAARRRWFAATSVPDLARGSTDAWRGDSFAA